MNQKSFKLAVPSPCSEKWENMIPTNSGRHCENCNHEVVDFTNFDQNQLFQYFAIDRKFTCGIFRNEQLSSFSNPINQHPSLAKTVMLAASMSVVGANVSAQTPEVSINSNQHKMGEVVLAQGTILIQGRITQNDIAIPRLLVRIESHSSVMATTDSTGNFTIQFFGEVTEQTFILQVIDPNTNTLIYKTSIAYPSGFFSIELPEMTVKELDSFEVKEEIVKEVEMEIITAGVPVMYHEIEPVPVRSPRFKLRRKKDK